MRAHTCAGGWLDRRGLLVLGALALVSVVLGALASNFETFPLDRTLTPLVRDLGPSFQPIADVPNEGNGFIALGALVLGAGVLFLRRQPEALAMLLTVGAMRPLLEIPKDVVDRPRPSGDFAILDVVRDSSFPSGHVMTATTFIGLWFVLAPELVPERFVRPVRIAAVAIVMLYATARMWAGVHWFSDTIGGVLWAAALLALGVALRPALGRLLARLRLARPRQPSSEGA